MRFNDTKAAPAHYQFGLDRFRKATTAEPFSVTQKVSSIQQQQQPAPPPPPQHYLQQFQVPSQVNAPASGGAPIAPAAPPVSTTAFGAGGSAWQPPDWATDPKSLVYWLDVMKDGEVVDKITLDRKRLIFGRQQVMCDLVLDHPSVSRQHAAVVPHKNGGIYVIDLGSVHGTFVANERLTKDNPVELEIGQSLRFAASTRIYVLRKSVPTPVVPPPPPTNIVLPPPPDRSDEEAVLEYNTTLNRLGVPSPSIPSTSAAEVSRRSGSDLAAAAQRPKKKPKNTRVSFRDDYGGNIAEVVGISDGADVSTEPGPVGVREGSLVGKFDSLVQVTVIPKGQEEAAKKAETGSSQGVTQRLQQYLDKVKSPGKGGLYGDMYGESLGGIAGGHWAAVQTSVSAEEEGTVAKTELRKEKASNGTVAGKAKLSEDLPKEDEATKAKYDTNDDDDLFGDDEDT